MRRGLVLEYDDGALGHPWSVVYRDSRLFEYGEARFETLAGAMREIEARLGKVGALTRDWSPVSELYGDDTDTVAHG